MATSRFSSHARITKRFDIQLSLGKHKNQKKAVLAHKKHKNQ
jgi:hypothetical protein